MFNLFSTMGFFSEELLADSWPQPLQWHWVILAQVQDLVFTFDEIHEVSISPFLQPVQVPLNSIPTLQCYNHFLQFGVSPKLAKSAPCPVIFCPHFSSGYGNPAQAYLV